MGNSAAGNPFRASRLRPGLIPFYHASIPDLAPSSLLDRLAQTHLRGQIVGPHGSGKSTLWTQLSAGLVERHYPVISYVCTQDAVPTIDAEAMVPGVILAIDGFEQLPRGQRVRIVWTTWRNRCGLLITTHRKQIGVPTLMRTIDNVETLRYVVEFLWHEQCADHPLPAELTTDFLVRLLKQHGTIRETLFALYDWFNDADPKCTDAGTAARTENAEVPGKSAE